MENYPFYIKFIRTIQFQFRLLSRIKSVLTAPDSEICPKNKLLAIKMTLCAFEDELVEIERTVLQEEFNHMEAEVLETQEQMTALSLHFTINLN